MNLLNFLINKANWSSEKKSEDIEFNLPEEDVGDGFAINAAFLTSGSSSIKDSFSNS